jgi:periplasmic protein TonB
MKKILFLFIAFFILQLLSAQEKTTSIPQEEVIFDFSDVDVKPEFPGGMDGFYKYIANNFKPPYIQGLKGKLIVSFVIEKDGSIIKVKIIKNLGYGMRKETERVLKNSPKWSPADKNGQKVRCLHELPISIENSN